MKYHFMGLCFQRFVVQHLPRVPQSDRHAQIAVAPCQTARLSLRLRLLRCTREMTPAHFRIIVLLSKDIANGSSQQFRNFRIRRMVSCERAKDQYDSRYAMRKTDVVTSYTFFYGRQRRLPLKPIAVANSRAVQPTGGFRRECFIFTEMIRYAHCAMQQVVVSVTGEIPLQTLKQVWFILFFDLRIIDFQPAAPREVPQTLQYPGHSVAVGMDGRLRADRIEALLRITIETTVVLFGMVLEVVGQKQQAAESSRIETNP